MLDYLVAVRYFSTFTFKRHRIENWFRLRNKVFIMSLTEENFLVRKKEKDRIQYAIT